MNLKNQPPIFVPNEYQTEIEKLSKAFLMDIAWDYAMQVAASEQPADIMKELRTRATIVGVHRHHAKVG